MSRIRSIIITAVTAIACVIAIASSAGAANDVTVVTKAGDRYEHASITIDNQYKTIKIVSGDTKKNISFTDVQVIYDKNGKDITSKFVKGYAQPSRNTWSRIDDPSFIESKRLPYTLGLRFAGNFSVPFGDYYDGIESGIGYEGDIIVPVTAEYALRASMSVSGMKVGAMPPFEFAPLPPHVSVTGYDLSIQAIRYTLALQLQRPLDRLRRDKGMWFTYAGLGAITHKFDASVTLYHDSLLQYSTGTSETSETKFLTNIGFGILPMITSDVGLDLSVNLDMVWVGSENTQGYGGSYSGMAFGYVFDIKAGVLFALGAVKSSKK
jgi:hypothetical protein